MQNMPEIFVANWKMNQRHAEAASFAEQTCTLAADISSSNKQLVLCPSFPSLVDVATITSESLVTVGAQDCSAYADGPYTGQVSATMIADAGCSYCIVGHSERRRELNESPETVAQKTARAVEGTLAPIICIGETLTERNNGHTFSILEAQLNPIITALTQCQVSASDACIAYEPVWAIGTGVVPEETALIEVFSWLANYISTTDSLRTATLLYGGSVTAENGAAIMGIEQINGLLIGGASIDFQSFRKIVLL